MRKLEIKNDLNEVTGVHYSDNEVDESKWLEKFNQDKNKTDEQKELENKIKIRLAKQDVGRAVLATATEINKTKGYTLNQLIAMASHPELNLIKMLADTGSLDMLSGAIQNHDGTFYNADDKVQLLKPIIYFVG